MDSLLTCMICSEEFEERGSVVVVYDATFEGMQDESGCLIDKDGEGYTDNEESENYRRPVIAQFELDDVMGAHIERAVYCTECWGDMVEYSWKKADELAKSKDGKEQKWKQ